MLKIPQFLNVIKMTAIGKIANKIRDNENAEIVKTWVYFQWGRKSHRHFATFNKSNNFQYVRPSKNSIHNTAELFSVSKVVNQF